MRRHSYNFGNMLPFLGLKYYRALEIAPHPPFFFYTVGASDLTYLSQLLWLFKKKVDQVDLSIS